MAITKKYTDRITVRFSPKAIEALLAMAERQQKKPAVIARQIIEEKLESQKEAK